MGKTVDFSLNKFENSDNTIVDESNDEESFAADRGTMMEQSVQILPTE